MHDGSSFALTWITTILGFFFPTLEDFVSVNEYVVPPSRNTFASDAITIITKEITTDALK